MGWMDADMRSTAFGQVVITNAELFVSVVISLPWQQILHP